MRIAIIGPPKSGKTTLARKMSESDAAYNVRSTDETIGQGLSWSDGSAEVATWFDQGDNWLIEGVAVPRALRKWRANNPHSRPPVDKIIVLTDIHEPHSKGQAAMAKGLTTVWTEILPWLRENGVEVEVR